MSLSCPSARRGRPARLFLGLPAELATSELLLYGTPFCKGTSSSAGLRDEGQFTLLKSEQTEGTPVGVICL